ncbi:MAG: hypothetical protein K2W82_06105 [Candidatus Obscuribacterales bacterium]|nr:hypothetical protein [Candidatus Obscuribacterales bacterium]
MKFHTNMFGWEYVWRDFADSCGGEIVTETKDKDSAIVSLSVPALDKASTITITPTAAGTSAVIHYQPTSEFAFSLQIEKLIHQFGKALGLQDLQVGDKEFDHKFLIQANNEAMLKFILDDAKLRELLLLEETTEFRMVTEPSTFDQRWLVPANQHVLLYSRAVLIDKFEHLESVCKLLYRAVERLAEAHAVITGVSEEKEENRSGRLNSPLLKRS